MGRYTILQANPIQNKKDILPILMRNLEALSNNVYQWKYERCPYGEGLCWLVKDEQTNLFVGAAALFPRKFFVNGKEVVAGIAGDFAVDKEHRIYGPALKVQKTIQSSLKENNLKFIYGVPNKLAEALFLKIGYKEIGKYNRFIKILKTEYKLKKHLPPALFTKMFSKIINFAIKILSTENRHKRHFNFSIEMPTSFDERFDRLWEETSKKFNIVGERSSKFLNWRYKQSSYQDYKIFALITDKKDIAGYIVYYIKENMCHIVDMLFINSKKVVDSLLAKFILYMRKKDVGSISIRYFGHNLLTKKLKKFGFSLYKRAESKILIYIDQTCPLVSCLLNKDNWYFLEGDNDI